MEAVLKHSRSASGARLVLLALAYHADAHGLNAFPSVQTLADECNLTRRQVQYNLRALEALGEVCCRRGTGRGHANVYDILIVKGATDFTLSGDKGRNELHPLDEERAQFATHKGRNLRQERAQSIAPQQSYNSQGEESGRALTRAQHGHKNGKGKSNGANKYQRQPSNRERAIAEGFKGAFGIPLEQALSGEDAGEDAPYQAGPVHKLPGPRKSA